MRHSKSNSGTFLNDREEMSVASSRLEFQKVFAHLREIENQQSSKPSTDDQPYSFASVESLPKKKKVGRPKKPSSKPKPSTKGKRLLLIGGSELQSDVLVESKPTRVSQRSVGQTCQPKTRDAADQVIFVE